MADLQRVPIDNIMRRQVVYRLYSHRGILLYVGVTQNLGSRLVQHARVQPWWGQVRTCSQEFFTTRSDAEEAERAAISSEDPRHNAHLPADALMRRRQAATVEWLETHARCRVGGGYRHSDGWCPDPGDAYPMVAPMGDLAAS